MTTKEQIAELAADQLIATDEGTHSHPETVRVYERMDGTRYGVRYFTGSYVGSAQFESAHGRLRWLAGVLSPAERRKQINHLREMDVQAAKAVAKLAHHREQLARGWDGYRFVGVEEGQRLLAAN